MKFEQFADRVECFLAQRNSFIGFLLWCAVVPVFSVDVANYGISFITAALLFIMLGPTRKDRKGVQIKLDDLEDAIEEADSSNVGIEKRIEI